MRSLNLALGVILLAFICGCKLDGSGSGSPAQSASLVPTGNAVAMATSENPYSVDMINSSAPEGSSERRQDSAAIPEPATMVTLGLGSVALVVRKLRKVRGG